MGSTSARNGDPEWVGKGQGDPDNSKGLGN